MEDLKKKRDSVTFDFSLHDEINFSCPFATNGKMTIVEINAAIEAVRGKDALNDDGQGLVFHSENTLKIMLGLWLCF